MRIQIPVLERTEHPQENVLGKQYEFVQVKENEARRFDAQGAQNESHTGRSVEGQSELVLSLPEDHLRDDGAHYA